MSIWPFLRHHQHTEVPTSTQEKSKSLWLYYMQFYSPAICVVIFFFVKESNRFVILLQEDIISCSFCPLINAAFCGIYAMLSQSSPVNHTPCDCDIFFLTLDNRVGSSPSLSVPPWWLRSSSLLWLQCFEQQHVILFIWMNTWINDTRGFLSQSDSEKLMHAFVISRLDYNNFTVYRSSK